MNIIYKVRDIDKNKDAIGTYWSSITLAKIFGWDIPNFVGVLSHVNSLEYYVVNHSLNIKTKQKCSY